jgi:cytidine diphosphoramidate kinase
MMVVWLVGLSGAGKSTIGREVYRQLKQHESNTVLVDGDEIRALFKHDTAETSYNLEGRRLNAERIVEICKWLDGQSINVVCCILCVFPDILKANRKQFKKYLEVFISAPYDVLRARDAKGLYVAAEKGEQSHVVGVDIPFPEPVAPDLILDSSGKSGDFAVLAEKTINLINNSQ